MTKLIKIQERFEQKFYHEINNIQFDFDERKTRLMLTGNEKPVEKKITVADAKLKELFEGLCGEIVIRASIFYDKRNVLIETVKGFTNKNFDELHN